ncbi:YpoC family protein [Bacillus massiliigorillae]|uniref:YpoC family protein n=1 Tax=Bacillus massiliigorillae TaxID=1243664 RepID=UPI0003A0308E|nr:hypothetical protein [Bacillus massiliigorillae]
MMNVIKVELPTQLQSDLFFLNEQSLSVNVDKYLEWDIATLNVGFYEALYFNRVESFQPWTKSEVVIPDIMLAWKEKQVILADLYAKRAAKEATQHMKVSIKYALAALYYANEQPIILNDWQKHVEQLEHVPVNFTERMTFILSRPNLYQSFKALEQIMIELEKMYARITIKKQNVVRKKPSQA